MLKTNDFTKAFQDAFAAFPMDASAMQTAFRNSAAMGEKFAKVALEAAAKSNEISAKWAKEAIAKANTFAKAKDEPADYSKAVTDFAAAAAEMTAENIAAFAEVAKKVQMDTVELVLSAGKEVAAEATAVVKKATSEAATTSKKAA